MRRRATLVFALALLALAPGRLAWANDSGPLPVPRPSVPASPPAPAVPPSKTAEDHYEQGRLYAQHRVWDKAEGAYREAVKLRARFPEAWNGLGYALRHQKKYDESIRAYDEALKLRPNYAEALEYLGEAYVQMGRLADAQAVLERLRPLDPKEAEELAKAIAASKR
jgi:tetratricopeptide (TPR) repeat protein